MKKLLKIGMCFAICGLSFGAHVALAQTPRYQLIDLGATADPHSYGLAINERGQVAGYGRSARGSRAFVFSEGRVTELSLEGGTNSYATSINILGQVAGFFQGTNGPRAFLYGQGRGIVFSDLADVDHYALGLNNSGWVVGYAEDSAGKSAFLFDGNELLELPGLGGSSSVAYGINSAGTVVGSSRAAGQIRARAVFWAGRQISDLSAAVQPGDGWELEEARAINDAGDMTGFGLRNGVREAFLVKNGRITGLGVLPNGLFSSGFGLNGSNQVVGVAGMRGLNGTRAILWDQGTLIDLNTVLPADSGWELREARGINNSGQIVGWGNWRGEDHAYLISPVMSEKALDSQKTGSKTPQPTGSARFFTVASIGSSVSVTNNPLADAHVRDGASNNVNFGLAPLMDLQTGPSNGTNKDVYLKFSIDNAPSPLGSAKLRIFASYSNNGSVTSTVYSVSDTNWTETGIKWTNRPALGTVLTNQIFNVKAGASYDIDVTSYLRTEQNAGRGIITLALHNLTNTTLLTSISSLQNTTTNNRPKLILLTNTPPTVSITTPANGAAFPAPTNLVIGVTSSDTDGTVTNLDLYAGGLWIGQKATNAFSFTWTNAPVGTFALTARATDNLGCTVTSAVVNVVVTTNLIAVADSYVTNGNPNANFGLTNLLFVQTNGVSGPIQDTYLMFNLSSVTNISSAKVRIFASISASGTGSSTYYTVADTNWAETGITWNNKPPRSNALNHVRVTSTTAAWFTNDITAFVQGEKAAGRNLISLALHSQTNASIFTRINSRQAASNRVEIIVTTTNSPPAVVLTNPANGSLFIAPANLSLQASASDSDGSVSQVEFFASSTSLGVDASVPYGIVWSNAPSGVHALTARATDNYGLVRTSVVVSATVDFPPAVTLTAPAHGAVFTAYPTNITISANASDSDGTISQVDFFTNGVLLATDTSSPYSVPWNNVSAGVHTITARATDNLNVSVLSAPATISVNILPTVAITAPTNASTFAVPTNIVLTATASDSDGTISQVDFYAGSIWIGGSQSSPYSVVWSNAPAGIYALTARATDNLGGVSTSAPVNITVTFSPSTVGGLKLWLDAGAGVLTSGSGQVTNWTDQSGNGNDATQAATSSQAALVSGVLNGRPVVRFDAIDDYFRFGTNPFAGSSAAEAFVVLKAVVDAPGIRRSLWTFGGGPTDYPSEANAIRDGFCSYGYQYVGDPSQPLDQFHLYNNSAAPGGWSARLNGMLLYAATNNVMVSNAAPALGAYSDGGAGFYYFFGGDIAEILVYNRTLTANERDAVGRYLSGKYALMAPPAAPANLTALALSSTQISLNWNVSPGNPGVKYVVERKAGSAGLYGALAVVEDGASFIDSTAAAGTTWFYRVKAVNYGGQSDYSNEASATPAAGQTAMPLTELVLWLKSDAGHGTNLNIWADQSGHGNHALQAATASQPQVIEGALNGRSVVRFDAYNDYFGFQNKLLEGVTQAEAFVVVKAVADAPGAVRALWTLGGGPTYYPLNDNTIHDGFFSFGYQSLGNPLQPLDQFHLYNNSAAPGAWSASINGLLQYATVQNVMATSSVPTIGTYLGVYFFAGDIAEILVYNRTLSDAERRAVGFYLNDKYRFISSAPPVPSGLSATAVSSTRLTLAWTNTVNTISVAYVVERRLDAGVYAPVGTNWNGRSLDDFTLQPGSNYFYRVKAVNYYGESAYSVEISPPSTTLTNPPASQAVTIGANHNLSAVAADLDGSVTQVAFYAQSRVLGVLTNSPYSITWTNPIQGGYSLLTKAWDNAGNTRFSAIVSILVALDTDGDGVNDFLEILNGTNPLLADTDGDGVPDGLDAFPLDPGRSSAPAVDPADQSPPIIILDEPGEATLLP